MSTAWVIVEQRDGVAASTGLELIAAARLLADEVVAWAWGSAAAECAATLGAHGAASLYDLGEFGDRLAAPRVAAALASEIAAGRSPETILLPTTHEGRDVAARLSVLIDRPVLTNVSGLEKIDEGAASDHAALDGASIVRARFTGPGPALFVVRPKAFDAADVGGPGAAVTTFDVPPPGVVDAARISARNEGGAEGPRLDEAAVVVAGGRGLGAKEEFELIETLAALLKGAPAASRAVVDDGWVPYAYQVGQTGQSVKPDVYLAFGISGAIQHLVGMRGSSHVIAVNTDKDAPIFLLADLGIVGDAPRFARALIAALQARV